MYPAARHAVSSARYMGSRNLEEASLQVSMETEYTCLLYNVYALCTIVLFHFFLYKHVL